MKEKIKIYKQVMDFMTRREELETQVRNPRKAVETREAIKEIEKLPDYLGTKINILI